MSADGALVRWLRGGTAGGGGAEAISRATTMPERPRMPPRSSLTNPDGQVPMSRVMNKLSTYASRIAKGEEVGAYEFSLFEGELQWSLRDDRLCAPHWKYFAAALRGGRTVPEFWTFRNLPSIPTQILVPALSRRNVCSLDVRGVGGFETFRFICEMLENSGCLKRLVLEDYDFFDADYDEASNVARFCHAVERNGLLEELTLGKMELGSYDGGIHDEENPLPSILSASRNLQYLNLLWSCLGEDGCQIIAEFIEGNPRLAHLVLGCSKDDHYAIDQCGVACIAGALRLNTNLRSLDFFGLFSWKSDTTGEFAATLREALFATEVFHHRGLNAVARSNHTCFVHLTTCGSNADTALLEVLNCNESPTDNKRWKILSVLYATNCKGICNEMERVPVAVLPDVLALISAGMDEGQLRDVAHDGVSGAVIANIDAWGDATPNKTVEVEGLDDVSIGGDSVYSKDSILDDLESAFDEVDEVYDDFHRSFTGCGYVCPQGCESTGRRARLTMTYQLLKHYGLALMDRQQSHLSVAPKRGRGRRKRKRG